MKRYFSESEYFEGKFNYAHIYLHENYKNQMHSHQFYEINIIAAGEGQHLIDRSTLSAKAGDVFVIPPGVSHSYNANGKIDIYHILIKNEFLNRYSEELSELDGFDILFDIEPQIRRASGRNHNPNIDAHELSVIKDDMERMMRAENSKRFVYLNALLLAFICRLCRKISGAVLDFGESGCVVEIMEYIKENVSRKLTLDELTKFSNMSKATLNRRFKSVIGMSPMNYVLSCRIAQAKELLSGGELNKTEIAAACGFFDVAHLNKYLNKGEKFND